MLRRELIAHQKQYFSLVVGVTCFLLLFFLVWPDTFWIRTTAVLMGVFYILWGILTHHYVDRRVFWEYVAVAFLGGLMIFMLTF